MWSLRFPRNPCIAWVCVSLASDFSETVEVIFVNFWHGDCLRHGTASRLNYIVQGHTYLKHEKIKQCPSSLLWRSSDRRSFIQGHKCVSNVTTYNLQYLGQYLSYYIQTWRDGKRMDAIIIIMLVLVSMTLTLMQGHNGPANANNQHWMFSAIEQAISITVGHFIRDLDFANVCMVWHFWKGARVKTGFTPDEIIVR